MKTYTGTKTVQATPMTRAAYNDYRGWDLPGNEDGTDEGYLVEYTDGGKANDARHAGYISWSPKAQFDAAYIDIGDVTQLPPHMQRVVAEKAALDSDREKLWIFMNGKSFMAFCDEAERDRLHEQANVMARYSDALESRIVAFKKANHSLKKGNQ